MTDSVTLRVPALKPIDNPIKLREATVRDYKGAAERAGVPVSMREIERVALRDCEVYEGVKRAAPAARKQTPEELAEVRRIKRAQLEQEAQAAGATTVIDPRKIQMRRVKQMHAVSKQLDRWAYAKGRIARICAGMSRSTDLVKATSTCEIPHLALAVFRLQADFKIRFRQPRPGDEPNPFFGMSDVDAGRLLQRKVEDICDASTGRLGPWLVPK